MTLILNMQALIKILCKTNEIDRADCMDIVPEHRKSRCLAHLEIHWYLDVILSRESGFTRGLPDFYGFSSTFGLGDSLLLFGLDQ